ncbi:hypothetical protein jhhlp_004045 [Lomentospora prolificans]|uniref:ER membrane protein complex subunit 1 n=1 Tax=Lomentospora prolificans TaxID=41688 RepID=A0A2N3NAH0_9PEZI|nr:hypothetical protein jhhlp_004045 [Lomentospora prolificans]
MRFPLFSAKAFVFFGLPYIAQAVFPDEVGTIDFHYDLLGVPQASTTLFHKPRKIEKASLLYTLSDVGIIGAVNPSNGAVVWRQQVTGNITTGGGFLRAGDGQSWLCGAYGNSVHAWDALTGRNTWRMDFAGEIKDLEILEVTGDGRKDVLVLLDEAGSTIVRRLRGDNGNVVWEATDSGKDIPLQVSTNIESVFYVSLHGSPYSLKLLVLDIKTGKRTNEIVLGTNGEVQSPEDVMFVGSNSAAPIIAWTDSSVSKLRVNVIGTKNKLEFPLAPDAMSVDIHAPHLAQSNPHFLVHTRTKTGNRAEVYHINLKNNDVSKAYDLPHLPGLGAISTSTDGANVYFTRVTEEDVILVDSTSHGILGKWPIQRGLDVPALHAATEIVKKPGDKFAVRSAITTTADEWILVRNGDLVWARPEGMSAAVAAAWAEIPESENLSKVLEEEAHTSPLAAYVSRAKRHLNDFQYLPDYLAALPSRFVGSILGGLTDSHPLELTRDSFGFRKLIILATRRGKVYALDTGNHGRVLWSKKVVDLPKGQTWDVSGILVDELRGLVQIVGSHGDVTIIRPDTGEIVDFTPPQTERIVYHTARVDSPEGPRLLTIGPDGSFEDPSPRISPNQTIVLRGTQGEIKGVKLRQDGALTKQAMSWTFTPPAGQDIVSLSTRPSHDPVASIGRVLGDRKVRYKYLNPNTILIAAVDRTQSTLSIYLLDSVSGQVLTSALYEGVDSTKAIDCVMSENWFACTFFGQYNIRDGTNRNIKGYQISMTDLYESEVSNDRGPLGDAESYSPLDPVDAPTNPVLPFAETLTWVVSSPIERLSVTQTRQGITRRQLLAYMPESHSVIGIPREVVDPRRPVGRDPTKEEMEAEGLARYAPQIELDPRLVISHVRDVIGVKEIVASPTTVESTSLVLAYGIDVFASRVTPSLKFDVLGREFNKVALLGTVGALALSVMALKPIVRRKQTDRRWEAPS